MWQDWQWVSYKYCPSLKEFLQSVKKKMVRKNIMIKKRYRRIAMIIDF